VNVQRVALAAFVLAAMTAGCGGGSSSVPSAGAPSSGSSTVSLSGAAGTPETFALPSEGGYSGTIALTSATTVSGVTLDLVTAATPPGGAPAPSGTGQALVFVGVTASSTVSLAAMPAFTFTVPESALQSARRSQQSNSELSLSLFDPTNPTAGYQSGGTCSQSSTTVTCVGTNASFTLSAQQQYVFELSISPASTGSTVISVPAAAPIVCSPPSVVVLFNGTVVIDCSAQGYSGAFTLSLTNPAVASVVQSDDLTFTYFNVTGLEVGTTMLSLRSQPGGTGSVAITVVP
jgi:hypothetical protein